jgi:hypothetical protein
VAPVSGATLFHLSRGTGKHRQPRNISPTVTVKGIHFLREESPAEIGAVVAGFVGKLRGIGVDRATFADA